MTNERWPLVTIDGHVFTVPVGRAVEKAIYGWFADHLDDLNERLDPFGLSVKDLALPDCHRVVYVDEISNKSLADEEKVGGSE